jgi:hypothetical protein
VQHDKQEPIHVSEQLEMRSSGVEVGERWVGVGGSVLVEEGWGLCDGGLVRLVVSFFPCGSRREGMGRASGVKGEVGEEVRRREGKGKRRRGKGPVVQAVRA